jgi:hypothetical protein
MTARIKNNQTFFSSNGSDPYKLINLILAGIIICILLYSAIFSPLKNNYPLISFHDHFTGRSSISTGLSRGFSSIMRGNFSEALEFNIYSLRLFSFFLIQFLMRCLIFLFIRDRESKYRGLISMTDIFVSIGLFIFCFFPFLKDVF